MKPGASFARELPLRRKLAYLRNVGGGPGGTGLPHDLGAGSVRLELPGPPLSFKPAPAPPTASVGTEHQGAHAEELSWVQTEVK